MIGFLNPAVVMTYLGLLCSALGILLAMDGHTGLALTLFGTAALCDCFDGTLARRSKKSNDTIRAFGIQVDSLADMVSFGMFPIAFAYSLGMTDIWSLLGFGAYLLACITRLANYNITTSSQPGRFTGLPVTTIAPVFGFLYTFFCIAGYWPTTFMKFLFPVLAVFYVAKITILKPKPKYLLIAIPFIVYWFLHGFEVL